MRFLLPAALAAALASPVRADEPSWRNGAPWRQAFPESEIFGAFAPQWAASTAGARVRTPEGLIQYWNRLPNDLHQQDCGTDSLRQPKRCLDATFLGSGEYAGTSVTAHFDTIGGSSHFMGFDVR
jgi:hypothetical protein